MGYNVERGELGYGERWVRMWRRGELGCGGEVG